MEEQNRHFDTGAKRDKNDDKGRMDLIPWEIIELVADDYVISLISKYQSSGDVSYLYDILKTELKSSDLIPLSKIYQNGANKYGENNWKKGIPEESFLDSGLRHYVKYKNNIIDEPHYHMFLWNIIGLIWTLEQEER